MSSGGSKKRKRTCKECGKLSRHRTFFKDDLCATCYQAFNDDDDDGDDISESSNEEAEYCKLCREFLYNNKSDHDGYCSECVERCQICGEQTHPHKIVRRPLDDVIRTLIDEIDDVEAVLDDTPNGTDVALCRPCAQKHKRASSKDQANKKQGSDEESEEAEEDQHCMRCHSDFDPDENGPGECVIEHDEESFEGSRNGSWYIGTLRCCGAKYKFHRHYSDSRASPKYCYEGPHTSDPNEVEYNDCTIRVCDASSCGNELHQAATAAQQQQVVHKQELEQEARASEEAYWASRVERTAPDSNARRREERKARAARLGLYDGTNSNEFDSDKDSACEEFDYASDSSLEYGF